MSPEERDLFPEIVQLLADADAALAIPGGAAAFPPTDETVWAAVLVARAHDLIRGTRACIDAEQSMSALVLQRPLFEDSVLLTRASAVEGLRRFLFVVRWYHDSAKETHKLANHLRPLPGEAERAAQLQARAAADRQSVSRMLRQRGVALPDINLRVNADVAKACGRERDYPTYRMTHHAVHGNELVHAMAGTPVGEDGWGVGIFNRAIATMAAAMATSSALALMKAREALLNLPCPATYVELAERLDELHASGTQTGEN